MNDATPWIDPELVAAGQLLQSKGLVAPDRTKATLAEVRAATDRIGAFLGEGSVPLKDERDLSLPGPHGQVPCRLYRPDGVSNPQVKSAVSLTNVVCAVRSTAYAMSSTAPWR